MNRLVVSLVTAICFSFSHHLLAFRYYKGEKVKEDITKSQIMNALRLGNGSVKGVTIVLDERARVPNSFKKRWMSNELAGKDIPKVGKRTADVIYVMSF